MGATYKDFLIPITNVVEDLDGDGTEDAYDSDRDGDGIAISWKLQTDPIK